MQHLAPEIGVDGNGLPAHGSRGRIGQPVKAIHEAGFFVAQWKHNVRQQIRRHAHVGVADKNQIVLRQFFQLGELGNLGVCALQVFADNKLRVALWISGDDFPGDFVDRIVSVRDAEEDLHRAGIILPEPALERFGGGLVAALERFEQGDGRRKISSGSAPVQREPAGGQPLPERERAAQERKGGENCVGEIQCRKGNEKTGADTSRFNPDFEDGRDGALLRRLRRWALRQPRPRFIITRAFSGIKLPGYCH